MRKSIAENSSIRWVVNKKCAVKILPRNRESGCIVSQELVGTCWVGSTWVEKRGGGKIVGEVENGGAEGEVESKRAPM